MRTAIYQNRLALDYLLAEKGGVWGKFSTSECCLEIDDNGEIIRNITHNIRKLTHVSPQTWNPLFKGTWLDKWLRGEWWRKAVIIGIFVLSGVIFLPCIIPCIIKAVTTTVQAVLENTTVVQKSLEKMSEEKVEKVMLMQRSSLPDDPKSAKKLDRQYKKWKKIYKDYESPV